MIGPSHMLWRKMNYYLIVEVGLPCFLGSSIWTWRYSSARATSKHKANSKISS